MPGTNSGKGNEIIYAIFVLILTVILTVDKSHNQATDDGDKEKMTLGGNPSSSRRYHKVQL